MSYRLPSVSVSQILLRASQDLADSDLLPCLVGPLNQVVKDSAIALTYPVTSSTVIYPNLKLSAVVDSTTVKIKVTNAVVQIESTAVTTSILVAGTKTITGGSNKFLNAKVGDKIVFTATGHGLYTIASINGDVATTVETISYPAAIADAFTIQRSVGDVYCTLGGATYSTSSFAITSLKSGGYNIVSGTASVDYVALRKDLTGFYEVTNADQLAIDMDLDFENPLGFYLGTIVPSANGGVKKALAYILSDRTDQSYVSSLDDLATRRDAYLLVPLSGTSTVKNAFAAHVTAMSQPDSSYFRSAILSADLTTSTILVSGSLTK